MQKKTIISISVGLICLCITACGMIIFNRSKKDDNVIYNITNQINLNCLYYNELDFSNIKKIDTDGEIGTIRGIIVPHHLIAKDFIHEAFLYASKSQYKNIVIFGPDHESIYRSRVFTSASSWQTPFGILDANKDVINKLHTLDFVIESDEKLTIEHSISGLVPYIKYYFDDVNIIPLAITKQLSLENLDKLLDVICDNININETLFISSVDFSHYLDLKSANNMDDISIQAIMDKDYGKITRFTNDNLDSPNSIIAMLKSMERANCPNTRQLNRGNSEIVLNKRLVETTSYITFLFYD